MTTATRPIRRSVAPSPLPPEAMRIKQYGVSIKDGVNDKTRTIPFSITTFIVDRTGEVVVPKGGRFENYLQNPIVLFGHNSQDLPVGACLELEKTDQEVIALTRFAGLAQLHPFAETVYRLYRDKFLRAVSVGMLPVTVSQDKLLPTQTGIAYLAWELFEYSCVPIPANPQALARFSKAFKLPSGATQQDLLDAIYVKTKTWAQVMTDLTKSTGALLVGDDAAGGALVPGAAWKKIEHRGDQWCVTTEDGSETLGCHDTKEDAEAQLAAVEANKKSADEPPSPPDQRDPKKKPKPGDRPQAPGEEEGDEETAQAEKTIDLIRWTLDPIRWNRQVSKAFDVARAQFPPATAELDLAARYIDCEVKELYRGGTFVPAVRMGSWLSALDEQLAEWQVDDLRNLAHDGAESPPLHEVVRLNPTRSRDFLVHGTRFMHQKNARSKVVLRLSPTWGGLDVTVLTHQESEPVAAAMLAQVAERAKDINFLRGEAFSLSGEFLPMTDETWDDVFLASDHEKAVRRMVDLINMKGTALPNRGMLLAGPPGTGKTLSGRVMRNTAKATFIWISSRDFYRAGAVGGFTYAFDLARECAPTILFFEDVDNWLTPGTIDLLKTEMDGIGGRSGGVVTILTTNFPEALPEALIDRPGRFHDVLLMNRPDATVRRAMLAKWLPDLSEEQQAEVVNATEGYSGAHIRELASFAKTLAEQDGLSEDDALETALAKVAEQRELIEEIQLSGSRYRPGPQVREAVAAFKDRAHGGVVTIRANIGSFTREIQAAQAQIKQMFHGSPPSPTEWTETARAMHNLLRGAEPFTPEQLTEYARLSTVYRLAAKTPPELRHYEPIEILALAALSEVPENVSKFQTGMKDRWYDGHKAILAPGVVVMRLKATAPSDTVEERTVLVQTVSTPGRDAAMRLTMLAEPVLADLVNPELTGVKLLDPYQAIEQEMLQVMVAKTLRQVLGDSSDETGEEQYEDVCCATMGTLLGQLDGQIKMLKTQHAALLSLQGTNEDEMLMDAREIGALRLFELAVRQTFATLGALCALSCEWLAMESPMMGSPDAVPAYSQFHELFQKMLHGTVLSTLELGEAVEKDGRVLSGKNLTKLKNACSMVTDVIMDHEARRPPPAVAAGDAVSGSSDTKMAGSNDLQTLLEKKIWDSVRG